VRAEELAGQVSGSGRALGALDDPFGAASKRAVIDAVETIRTRDPRIGLVVAVRPDTIWPAQWGRVALKRFTLRPAMGLLELLHVGGTANELERLAQASEGSPALVVELASIAATEPRSVTAATVRSASASSASSTVSWRRRGRARG
jgi:hypothetical protein